MKKTSNEKWKKMRVNKDDRRVRFAENVQKMKGKDENKDKNEKPQVVVEPREVLKIIPKRTINEQQEREKNKNTVDAIFVDNRCRYWIQQRIGDMMNANAFTTKSGYSFAVDVDRYAGGLCFRFARNGTEVARIDSNGYLYCSNVWLNGVNVLNILNSIRDEVGEIGTDLSQYVKHKQLKNGTYVMDVKDITTQTLKSGSITNSGIIQTGILYATTSITCDGPGLFTSLDIANDVKNTWYEKMRYEGYLANNEYLRIILKDLSKQGFIDFTRDNQYYKLKLYINGATGRLTINETGIEIDGQCDIHDDCYFWQKLYANDLYAASSSTINVHNMLNVMGNLQVSGLTQLNNIVGIAITQNTSHNDALIITDMSLTSGNGVDIRIGCDDFETGNSALICYHHAGNNDTDNHLSLGFEGYYDLFNYYRDKASFTKPLTFNFSTNTTYPIDITTPTLTTGTLSKIRINDNTRAAVFGLAHDASGYSTFIKNEGKSAEVRVWDNKVEIKPTLTMNHDVSGFCDSSDVSNSVNVDDSHLITAQAAKELNPFTEYPTHSIKTTTLPYTQKWSCLAYSPVLNIWLIMPNSSQYGAYSEDNGETWNSFNCYNNLYYRDVCWCDDVGQFFSVADSTQYAMLSNTGKSYESIYNMGLGSHNWIGCAYGNGVTIATNYDSSDIFYFQGGTHTRSISLAGTIKMTKVVFGGGVFLGACAQYNVMVYSYEGITWDTCGGIENNTCSDLFYGTDGCFVQLSNSRKYQVWRCRTNMNQGTPGPQPFYTGATQYLPDYGGNYWYAGAYGNGRYVVMMNGGDKFAVSMDPIPLTNSWVLFDISSAVSLPRISYGNGSFVIISQSSTANNSAYVLNFKQYKTEDIIIANNVRGDNEDRLESLEKQIRGLKYSILNSVYPIGSIYVNGSNNINPEDVFGFGTWQAIEDRFLYCVPEATATGTTGGEATHKLVESEMPSHTHGINGQCVNPGAGTWSQYGNYPVRLANDIGFNWSTISGLVAYNTGGNQPHNNMPPYITVHAWIRTA